MAANTSPLAFEDLFGIVHVEPSVTGLIETEVQESPRSITPNDIILLSPFRSGKPLTLKRFRTLSALANTHDPDGNADQGVALARMTRDPFADDSVFGSADILTVRVDTATAATAMIKASSTDLIQLTTADYGAHVNGAVGGSRYKLTAGTTTGKKLVIRDAARTFQQDNLGPLFSLEYTGDGTAATVTIRRSTGVLTYTGQPVDTDIISVNGVNFEFESTGGVTSGNVAVTIGADADATFAALVTAILANVPGVTATQDTVAGTVSVVGSEQGAELAVVQDTGSVMSVAHSGQATFLRTTLTGATDGSQDLGIPLTLAAYQTIQLLAVFINTQQGYKADISRYANPFLLSTSIDPVSGTSIKTTPGPTLTGYVAAIADFVDTQTQGNYSATVLVYGTEPDEQLTTDPDILFTGGTTPAVTATDWQNALDLVGSQVQLGGILLVDTDDESIMAMTVQFVEDQRALGKWFRAFFGANPYTSLSTPGAADQGARVDKFISIAGALDATRVRLVCQRMGVFRAGGTVEYLHPIYLAAALAGGAAGNRPYRQPLTNKRLRFVDIHEDDSFNLVDREALLQGGVTVVKREEDRIVVSLAVTTSHSADKRMDRVMADRDTVDLVDANVREAFLQFRGKWANVNVAARVNGILRRVLDSFAVPTEGALVAGVDDAGNPQPPWEMVPAGPNGEPYVIQAGVLKLSYRIFIGGELDHVSAHGYAEYARIVGSLGGSAVEMSTSVPV